MINKIKIESATYIDSYRIKITFSDGKVNVFDYKNLVMRDHEESLPYRDIKKFQEFKIINNTEIAWGEDWDMILPLDTIYNKKEVSKAGRKPVKDKKVLLRLYVNQSIVDYNGGIETAQDKCVEYLRRNNNEDVTN